MSRDSLGLEANLSHYLRSVGAREDDDLKRLREATAHHKMAMMQISPEQGQFMALLVELIGARNNRAPVRSCLRGASVGCGARRTRATSTSEQA